MVLHCAQNRTIYKIILCTKQDLLLWLEWNSYLINIMENTRDYSAGCSENSSCDNEPFMEKCDVDAFLLCQRWNSCPFFPKSRWNCVIWGSPSTAEASAPVKFHWPVGGALMQCFKAWERTGQRRREGWEEGRCCGRRAGPPRAPVTGLNSQGTGAALQASGEVHFWRGWIQIHKRQNSPLWTLFLFFCSQSRGIPPHTHMVHIVGFLKQTGSTWLYQSCCIQDYIIGSLGVLIRGTVRGMKRSWNERSSKNKKKSTFKFPETMREP